MGEKKFADHLQFEVDAPPVLVKPWTVRGVKTEHGTRYMLGIREGNADLEIPWLSLDNMEDLVRLKVVTRGTWPGTNDPKYTVIKNAPDIVVCKRKPKGEKYAHLEFAIPGEDDGPDMPAGDSAPAAPKEPAVQAAAPSRGAPPSMDDCVVEAIKQTKRICAALGADNFDDPLVMQAAIECAQKFAVTFYIESKR